MKRYEYKLHQLTLAPETLATDDRRNEEQVLDALNKLGQEGWRLSWAYGAFGDVIGGVAAHTLSAMSKWRGSLTFVLEREIAQ